MHLFRGTAGAEIGTMFIASWTMKLWAAEESRSIFLDVTKEASLAFLHSFWFHMRKRDLTFTTQIFHQNVLIIATIFIFFNLL